ncbi:MAG: hypothetical protein JRJ87_27510 [Deltaproteobacteria bacterium]|nr:hypothetical protein [Deltaproteobacteria bacterium]
MIRNILAFGLLLMVCIVAACGPIDAPDKSGEVFWTLTAKIKEAPDGVIPGTPRAAFAWFVEFTSNQDLGDPVIVDDVSVTPEVPVEFYFNLNEFPHDNCLQQAIELTGDLAGSGFQIATGKIMLYDDTNENGKLDVIDGQAMEFTDQLIGPREEYLFVFLEGDPSGLTSQEFTLHPGLNILQ